MTELFRAVDTGSLPAVTSSLGLLETLVAVLWPLLSVSAVPDQQFVAASEMLPEPARETFMTGAAQLTQRGLERGLVRGRQEGREEGREEGEHAALAFTVVRLARQRFGEVPAETAARIEASTRAELERYIDTILTADRLADLFA
jgi:flagellar biosynthesis/type III secretory pathway protein FliH